MAQKELNDTTKERILNEAEIMFAENGYRAVSVREITTAAGCNLAAVKYHFGSKHNLYMEVFRSRWIARTKRIQSYFRKTLSHQGTLSLSTLVRSLAQAFLEGPLTDEERKRHHQLIAREMSQPTEAFNLIAAQVMQPFFKELAGMFRSLVPEPLDEENLVLKIESIIALLIHFNFARITVTLLTGREYDSAFKSQLVEHITEFALNGLGSGKKE